MVDAWGGVYLLIQESNYWACAVCWLPRVAGDKQMVAEAVMGLNANTDRVETGLQASAMAQVRFQRLLGWIIVHIYNSLFPWDFPHFPWASLNCEEVIYDLSFPFPYNGPFQRSACWKQYGNI